MKRRLDSRRRIAESLAITRTVRTSELFGIGYAAVGASIYIVLGAVAGHALGLTPLVFLVVGVSFGVTVMVYAEGASMYPERGGSATFARYAFNEFWSFVTGWAILLDYVIFVAVAAFAVPHYLSAFSPWFSSTEVEEAVTALVIVAVAAANIRGFTARSWRRGAQIAIVDLVLLLIVTVVGLALLWDPSALTGHIDFGEVPTWPDLIYALVIATIAYIGIEAGSNLAPEIRAGARELRAMVAIGSVVTLAIYVGISVVALMALKVHPVADGGFATALGEHFVEAPVLGVVMNLGAGWLEDVLKYFVATVGTLILVGAANACMVGVSNLSYSLATNRQLPSRLARLHPRHSTPYVAIAIAAGLAIALILPDRLDLLLSIYAFGALISITLANASICVLRFKQPDRQRDYKMPLGVRVRGRELSLLSVVGTLSAFLAWVAVIVYRPGARWVGLAWMAVGVALYFVYRVRTGKSLTERITVAPESLMEEPQVAYGNILVPIFGTELDDDIVGTAGRLAAEQTDGDSGAVIEAMYALVVPVSLPLEAELPQEQIDRANWALARAKEVAEEYEGVTVATTLIRTRSAGAAICQEAERRNVEVIVVGGEKPSPIGGGSIFGGVAGRGTPFIGEVTEYVLRKAPCQVILTAPPEQAAAAGHPPPRRR